MMGYHATTRHDVSSPLIMELHLGVADGAREAEESEEELLSIFWKFTVRREPVQRGRLGLLGLQRQHLLHITQAASECVLVRA